MPHICYYHTTLATVLIMLLSFMIGGLAGSLGKIFDAIGDTTTSAILTDEEKRKREALRRDASLLSGLGHFASVSGHPVLLLMAVTNVILCVKGCCWWDNRCGLQASRRLGIDIHFINTLPNP